MKILVFFLSLVFLAACNPQDSNSNPIANTWLGKWSGPEGTSLIIAPTDRGYDVTIQNLDGPRIFPAILKGNALTFTRDKIEESIHPGNGVETGMKWLAEKQNCLIVKPGEGYCR